jgi:acyl-CoA oxidase
VQLVDAAEAHCRAFITDCYLETIRNGMSELSQPVREVMNQLCELYCVYWALKKSGDFLQVILNALEKMLKSKYLMFNSLVE